MVCVCAVADMYEGCFGMIESVASSCPFSLSHGYDTPGDTRPSTDFVLKVGAPENSAYTPSLLRILRSSSFSVTEPLACSMDATGCKASVELSTRSSSAVLISVSLSSTGTVESCGVASVFSSGVVCSTSTELRASSDPVVFVSGPGDCCNGSVSSAFEGV